MDVYETLQTDILILGSGGAGLCAAIHAHDSGLPLRITLAVKGLFGKSGCTRMVQGGYNVVLHPEDSFEKHFVDTLQGGQFLNNQELAWLLVTTAPERVRELENKIGCFFDRNPDGTIHQKPFAGQSFDRTVHRGDLTGIEIINRLAEQVYRRGITILEEHRALELLLDSTHERVVGALLLDIREGSFLVVQAKAVLLATGGGPSMYKIFASSADKSTDGIAIGYRAGAELIDMEMVQFHPTGLLAADSQLTGTVLEEGLRGAGGYLYNGKMERFMARYDPERMERSTRDIVARSSYLEIQEGRGTPRGGVYIDVSHLGADFVRQHFPGMVERCRDMGFRLDEEPVEVSPTAHYMMGGIRMDGECRSTLPGLFVAGEDSGGVHGANRLGGNGVACSTVFGGIAGESLARYAADTPHHPYQETQVQAMIAETLRPFKQPEKGAPNLYALRQELRELMWEKVGLVREEKALQAALQRIAELQEDCQRVALSGGRRFNLAWQDLLNLQNLLTVSALITQSALVRRESRGSHYRLDYPETDNHHYLRNVCLQRGAEGEMRVFWRPVALSRLSPPDLQVHKE
ncbi:MAG: FAD-binding protein [Nitrospinota bacterium]|nr:MAG: FAD-binding protein [Nitrospinota bacterium]